MNKRWNIGICTVSVISLLLCGCAANVEQMPDEAESQQDMGNASVEIADSTDKHIADKSSLYKKEDVTKVETMYLTVSTGVESDNTNHTWDEINSYSTYDYNDMGVERYKVNGILQVGDENGPAEGKFGYEDNVPNAVVCVRGQTSSRLPQKNYKIEIKKGKGKYKDQRTINLNKHTSDISRFTNKMCFDLISEMPDMISLRTQFVHLYVKDTTAGGDGQFHDYGLYTQVEQPNRTFLKHHGLDENGHLYKINFFEFYRNKDVIKLKTDSDYSAEAFERLLEIKGSDDHTKLIAMLEELNNVSIPINEVVEKWFEEDNLLTWLAFHILTGNTDTQSRNTLIYSPLNIDTWYFISWDCDGAFSRTKSKYLTFLDENPGWECGVSNYWGNVLFSRILKDESYRAKLDQKIQDVAALLSKEKLDEMQKIYAGVVKPYAYSKPDIGYTPVTLDNYDLYCGELSDEIAMNQKLYEESMQKPMPFFIGTPTRKGNQTQFNWDSSYSFEKQKIQYEFELARDYNFANPIIHEKNMLGLQYQLDQPLEEGQYFIRCQAKLEDGNSQYAFDYYVDQNSLKHYGVKCFYVLADGSIVEDIYEE